MAEQSAFADLDDAQLHYLKAQYLASLQLVDQTETALKAQLAEIGTTRKHLQELMAELDAQLAGPIPEKPKPTKPSVKPAGKAAGKPTPRRTPRTRPVPR